MSNGDGMKEKGKEWDWREERGHEINSFRIVMD